MSTLGRPVTFQRRYHVRQSGLIAPGAAGAYLALTEASNLWDFARTSTITDVAGAVSSVAEVYNSGTSTITQSTAGAKPTTNSRNINSKNVLDLDGGDYLISTRSAAAANQSVIAVVEFDSFATSAKTIVGSSVSSGLQLRADNATAGQLQVVKQGVAAVGNFGSFNLSTATPYVVGIAFSNASSSNVLRWWVNGTTETDSSHGQNLSGGGVVWVGQGFGSAERLDGKLGVIAYFDSCLSAVDLDTYCSRVQTWWGI